MIDGGPEISVVVPTFNRGVLLDQVITCLEKQTLSSEQFEVIVVDDGSTDDSPAVLARLATTTSLRLRTIRTRNQGAAKARNLGWRSSTAPFIAFLDDDCVAERGWLEAGLAMLCSKPSLGIVQGRTVIPEGTVLSAWTVTREVRWPSVYFESHNIFYRRAALAQTHGFDENLRIYGEDTALGWEVMSHGWERAFADDATVVHKADERGVRWHIRYSYTAERNLIGVAAMFPEFRRSGFWRPWAFQRHHAHYAVALAGLGLSLWRRPFFLLVLPYFWTRRPDRTYRPYARLVLERLAVDTGGFVGRKVGAVRYRRFVV
ncbi:MAG TPA: glycosyltransferase family A protein [Acidimicrobiales bacterium]|nr:glycosyltransferase family A protein [Acidimicrobiales bacterium]